jgi:GNAT superfamily N-acetyltransferase
VVDITFTPAPTDSEKDALVALIRSANEANGSGPDGYEEVGFFIRDSEGKAIGGLSGYALFGWLFIQFLAVPPRLRGTGAGTELLNRAEAWGRERRLVGMWLDTFAFGAPEFYKKRGFTVFGTIEDHPIGKSRYFFQKRLTPP